MYICLVTFIIIKVLLYLSSYYFDKHDIIIIVYDFNADDICPVRLYESQSNQHLMTTNCSYEYIHHHHHHHHLQSSVRPTPFD